MPELPEAVHEAVHDRFSRTLAVIIVLGTLLAAGVEFFQASASAHAAAAARDAQVHANQASFHQIVDEDAANVQYENFAVGAEDLGHAASVYQQQLDPSLNSPQLQAQLKLWQQLAGVAQSPQRTTLPALGETPNADPLFPDRFFSQQLLTSNTEAALSDGLNSVRERWSRLGGSLLAVLTLIAVGLYLLGLSLTLQLRIRYPLAGLGGILLLIALIRTTVLISTLPETPPLAAAQAYARGVVALFSASTLPDASGYRTAVKEFTTAIDLRPDFARAYYYRSVAEFDVDSPQRGQDYTSLTSPQALVDSSKDLKQSIDLGYVTSTAYGNLGFQEWELWLHSAHESDLEAALSDTKRAIALVKANPGRGIAGAQPSILYNLGLIELSAGDTGAGDDYQRAVQATIALNDVTGGEGLVGGALGDLSQLSVYRKDLTAVITTEKAYIASAVAARSLTPGGATHSLKIDTTSDVHTDVTADRVAMVAAMPNYDPATDVVSVQWYYRAASLGPEGWAVLPEASGPTKLQKAGGQVRVRVNYLAPRRTCLGDGDYRVEVYVNGRLADSRDLLNLQVGSFGPAQFNETRTLMCVPAGGSGAWQRLPASSSAPGLFDGYTSPDQSQGALIFRFDKPLGSMASPAQLISHYQQVALDVWDRTFPGQGAASTSGTDVGVTEFMWLTGENNDGLSTLTSQFTYAGGDIFVGAGQDADGSYVVGLIYGPDSFFTAGAQPGAEIFNSMSRMDVSGDPTLSK